jgi:hypothetical protein
MVDAPSGLGVQLLQRLHSKMKICKYLVPLGRLWAPYYFSCCYKFLEHRIIFILRLYLLGSGYVWLGEGSRSIKKFHNVEVTFRTLGHLPYTKTATYLNLPPLKNTPPRYLWKVHYFSSILGEFSKSNGMLRYAYTYGQRTKPDPILPDRPQFSFSRKSSHTNQSATQLKVSS